MAFSFRAGWQLESELTSPLDLSTPSSVIKLARQIAFSEGAGAGAANMIWSDRRTVAASATDAIDLAGSLTGPFGTTLTFARIKMLLVLAASGNTNNVNVVMPASNGAPLFLAAGDGIGVKPGGMFWWYDPSAAGVVVTGGTGDLLNLVNSGAGTSVTYDVVIVGASS
ncbi:unnamed protein product [[Actinomadura] parvosata subsp. kistnae]|uniref:Uncharacterized protein n=1 Tax=[Actinomadura] parvosata subsp. kistnae TaxID=1909395 RepID=A0A1V0ABP5_9ACTN|nr:hypothetical protein [Nonomuraea sp. ATCC 55076]AQZ67638.1 hypothetical protein BKM31_44775 [Nonomuraea sp. ATCC 55076]SPL94075.1 unnamed protein product [Actinomadura parvosata subsp. kistnae]